MRQLIHDVEVSVRRALAERLSEQPLAPHELVIALANDEIEVAHPLLVNSDVLQDLELIEIIRNRTLEHQLAIGIRKSVSEEVTDALIATDSVDVIKTLLENHHAKISQRTMEYLVEQSQRVDTYQNPLLRRPDLDTTLAKRMYWWVSAALRTLYSGALRGRSGRAGRDHGIDGQGVDRRAKASSCPRRSHSPTNCPTARKSPRR